MKKLNQKICEEFSKGNFEFAFPYFTNDVEWNFVGTSVTKGKEAVIAHCNKMMVEMDNSTLNNTDEIVGYNIIAVQGYCDYTNEGKSGKVEYCDVYKFAGDKLQEITSYFIDTKKE